MADDDDESIDLTAWLDAASEVRYLAPDGTPMEPMEWADLFEQRTEDLSTDSWWRRRTMIDENTEVSTVWLGLNHQFFPGPPLFWETMIFRKGTGGDEQWRYSSREEALDDHERIVRALRAGEEP